jgi:hypothetical protein
VNGRREHAARGLGAKVPDTHCRRRHSGRKISWQHGDPTGDRLDLFGTAGLCEDALDVWNFGYGEREEDEGSKLIPLHRRERSVRRGCLRLSGRNERMLIGRSDSSLSSSTVSIAERRPDAEATVVESGGSPRDHRSGIRLW